MKHLLGIAAAVLVALVVMSVLPDDITIGNYHVVPAHALDDLLAGVSDDTNAEADSITRLAEQRVDTCPTGMTCIADFSADRRGMEPLYDALMRRRALGRPVRIAVLGDSYIQCDIFTAPLRALLQDHFGGDGVGIVPMSNAGSNLFRRSVKHDFDTWEEHLANKKSGYDALRYGAITASYYTGGTWTQLQGVNKYAHLDSCCTSQLIYYAPSAAAGARATATMDGGAPLRFTLGGEAGFGTVSVDGHMGRVRWDISDAHGGIAFYGVSMDPAPGGVCLDNFAMESLSGYHLGNVPAELLADFDAVRHYDLVVLMFGQNVASPSYKSASAYDGYVRHMTNIIASLKQAMPGTGFLVVSIGDREVKRGGTYVTPEGIRLMIAAQQTVAMESGTAFFNLFEAMGGEGSVVSLVEQGMANKDYTHINHRGGEQLAPLLADAIVWGYDCYEQWKGGRR